MVQITQHIEKGKFKNKMNKMYSLNTSTIENNFCNKMNKNKNLICSACYARTIEKMYKGANKKYSNNGKILSKKLLLDTEIPYINNSLFRFHAIGELLNEIHFKNFILIIQKNSHCLFSLWTKRIDIVNKVLNQLKSQKI